MINDNGVKIPTLPSRKKVRKLIMVEGTPSSIERTVNALLEKGYKLRGDLMPYTPAGTTTSVFVQVMIKEE